jgi:hypothetical protein
MKNGRRRDLGGAGGTPWCPHVPTQSLLPPDPSRHSSGGARGIHLSSSEYPKNQMTNIVRLAFCVAGPGDPLSARQRVTAFPIPFVSVHLASSPSLLSLSLPCSLLFRRLSTSAIDRPPTNPDSELTMRLCVYAIQLCSALDPSLPACRACISLQSSCLNDGRAPGAGPDVAPLLAARAPTLLLQSGNRCGLYQLGD